MSILMTDEAVQAAWRAEQPTTYASIIETFLRYHATEGREALVEAVRLTLAPRTSVLFKAEAEAVVDALLTERTS